MSDQATSLKLGLLENGIDFIKTGVETFFSKEDTGSTLHPRWIINLPTKKSWRQPSQREWVRTGLDSLVEEVQRLGIQSLAVPALGCGNGGLEWATVLPLIQEAFARVPAVRVWVYPPA